jgi:hypothetical protein
VVLHAAAEGVAPDEQLALWVIPLSYLSARARRPRQ